MIKHRPMQARELSRGSVICDHEFLDRASNNYPAYVSDEHLLLIEALASNGRLATSRHNMHDDTDTLITDLNLTEPA